jgi:hypothetical protein
MIFFESLCRELNLVMTGGSDYHGYEDDVDIGIGRGGLAVAYRLLEPLKEIFPFTADLPVTLFRGTFRRVPYVGRIMADAREVLETMKKVAKIRIEMLREGVTFHNKRKQAFYLKEYEEKLREIEELIRRMNIRLVYSKGALKGEPPPET